VAEAGGGHGRVQPMGGKRRSDTPPTGRRAPLLQAGDQTSRGSPHRRPVSGCSSTALRIASLRVSRVEQAPARVWCATPPSPRSTGPESLDWSCNPVPGSSVDSGRDPLAALALARLHVQRTGRHSTARRRSDWPRRGATQPGPAREGGAPAARPTAARPTEERRPKTHRRFHEKTALSIAPGIIAGSANRMESQDATEGRREGVGPPASACIGSQEAPVRGSGRLEAGDEASLPCDTERPREDMRPTPMKSWRPRPLESRIPCCSSIPETNPTTPNGFRS